MRYVANPMNLTPDSTLNKEKGFTGMGLTWLITSDKFPVTSCAVGYTKKNPGGEHRLHYHTNAEELIIMLKGRAIERVGDEDIEIKAGDVMFIPKGVVHSHVALEPVETMCIYAGEGATSFENTGYVLVESSPEKK